MKRLDAWLVELGLVRSRTQAQQLIRDGEVRIRQQGQWAQWTQPSRTFAHLDLTDVELNPQSPHFKYVSRGGLKLDGALDLLGWDVTGWRAVDVGISTGGFTDCLLRRGCREIVGLDVGRGQLAEALRGDARIRHFEGVNVRQLEAHSELKALLGQDVDLCVVDVSFVSLTLVLPPLTAVLPASQARPLRLLLLVKPQFELGAEALDKKGVVRESGMHSFAVERVLRSAESCGFKNAQHFPSTIKGQDGNQEFFIATNRPNI